MASSIARVSFISLGLLFAVSSESEGSEVMPIRDLVPLAIHTTQVGEGLFDVAIEYAVAFEDTEQPQNVGVEVELLIDGKARGLFLDSFSIAAFKSTKVGGCGGPSTCPGQCCFCGGACPFLGDVCVTIGDLNACGCGTFRVLKVPLVAIPAGAVIAFRVDPLNKVLEVASGAEDNNFLFTPCLNTLIIPTLSRWALGLMALLLMAAASYVLRRSWRRSASNST